MRSKTLFRSGFLHDLLIRRLDNGRQAGRKIVTFVERGI